MLSFSLWSLVSITSIFQPSEIDKLIQELGSPQFAEREAATKRLEAIGAPAAEALRKAAASPEAEVRRRAETLLAGLKRKGFIAEIDKLVKQLGSPRFAEREAAMKRLEAIGAPAAEALRKAAAGPDAEIRRRAERLLGIIPEVARAKGQLGPKAALALPPLPNGVSDKELASRWREAYASWQKDQRRAPEAIRIIQQVSEVYSERLPDLTTAAAVEETQAMLFATLEILDGKPKTRP
jgi:hypothetical protein